MKVIKDNREEILARLRDVAEVALEAVGLQAEGDVKMACPVDTGLLRNSITHAVNGHPASTQNYQSNPTHATTPATQRAGTAGSRVNPVGEGSYSGDITDGSGEMKVFVGTNVFYAP